MVAGKQKLSFRSKEKNAKRPITLIQYRKIRKAIRMEGGRFASRNLLLVNLQTNTCISSSDVLKFKTGTVFRDGKIIDKFWINQKRPKKSQLVSATRSIRSDINRVIKDYIKMFGEDYFRNPCNPLFPSQRLNKNNGWYQAISYSAYRNILRKIFENLKMNPDLYGTHSLRAAIPQAYYLKTGDIKGANAIFDLKSGRTTITYIEEVTSQKAIEIKKELQFTD